MSYLIISFPNLIFHFLEIILTPKIFNNSSSRGILIFQIAKFYKIVSDSKLVNYYIIN